MSEKPKSFSTPHQSESIEEHETNLELISNLITDIEDHNQEHNSGALWGKSLARGLAGVIENEAFDFENAERETSSEMSTSTHVSLTELQARHRNTLMNSGLNLAHQPARNESQGISGEVFLKVINAEQFTSFIKSIDATKQKDQTLLVLQTLLKNIEIQLYFSAREGTLTEDEGVLDKLGEIVTYISTVSAELDLTKITTYKKFNDTGRLEEYIVVEQEGLWTEPDKGFGPADWVKDITPERLTEKWQDVLTILHRQEAKQTLGVAPELKEHLLKCITIANTTVDTLNWAPETKTKMHEILSLYTQKLRGNSKLN